MADLINNAVDMADAIWNLLESSGHTVATPPHNAISNRPVQRFLVQQHDVTNTPRMYLIEVSDVVETLMWAMQDEPKSE